MSEVYSMFRKNVLSVILLIFFLSSCAGTGLFSNAQNQFERGLELYNRSQYEEAITHFKNQQSLILRSKKPIFIWESLT